MTAARVHISAVGWGLRPRVQSTDRDTVTKQRAACTATTSITAAPSRGPSGATDVTPTEKNSITAKKWNDHRVYDSTFSGVLL
ncbi:hypothetical protein GCM10017668_33190 [Streptomyces tuirus]|uniref:Uncharacterized protein n=1 Tax=Streptomyces tuirus TaxID=68278 RepID=A0A7G1NIL4_9ACTN|nr:hypothetical protein GCM10017668_33190 [Streptomyces tuirus]